jgi:hypothetical protein
MAFVFHGESCRHIILRTDLDPYLDQVYMRDTYTGSAYTGKMNIYHQASK